ALDIALLGLHLDGLAVDELGAALQQLGTVALQQAAHPRGQLLDDAVLPILHLVGIDADTRHVDAMGSDGLSLGIEVGVRDQRLRRNATPVEADAADLFFFDAQGLLPQLTQADGAYVSARTTTH